MIQTKVTRNLQLSHIDSEELEMFISDEFLYVLNSDLHSSSTDRGRQSQHRLANKVDLLLARTRQDSLRCPRASMSLGCPTPCRCLWFVPPQTTVGKFSPLLTWSNTQALSFQRYQSPCHNNLALVRVAHIFIPSASNTLITRTSCLITI